MSDVEAENNATKAEATEPEEADVEAMLDLSKKKKKKKKPKEDAAAAAGEGAAAGDATATAAGAASGTTDAKNEEQRRLLQELDANQELQLVDDRKATWSYEDLLDRVVDLLVANNPDLVDKRRRVGIKPPHLQMLTSKKTLWVNFQENCSMIGRDPQHVYQFFMAELGTEGNFDGNQRLIIRGKYLSKYIESLLRKYIGEYVTCEMCRSPRTELNKDPASRLFFCVCKDCGSSRSVLPIRSGYHATSRADRRAARNAKG